MTHPETVDSFSEDELLRMARAELDRLGIGYEDRPGGFIGGMRLDPETAFRRNGTKT